MTLYRCAFIDCLNSYEAVHVCYLKPEANVIFSSEAWETVSTNWCLLSIWLDVRVSGIGQWDTLTQIIGSRVNRDCHFLCKHGYFFLQIALQRGKSASNFHWPMYCILEEEYALGCSWDASSKTAWRRKDSLGRGKNDVAFCLASSIFNA